MLAVNNLSVHYGERILFDRASFTINHHQSPRSYRSGWEQWRREEHAPQDHCPHYVHDGRSDHEGALRHGGLSAAGCRRAIRCVTCFCEEHQQLRLNYLPAYHPELNLQEVLWRTMRYEETTNTYFESIDTLTVSVFKRSQRWKPRKIKALCHFT